MNSQNSYYHNELATHRDKRSLLLENSGLPGPRANIELAKAFAETAGKTMITDLASISSDSAPANTPKEFLAFCGMLGLGRLVAEGKVTLIDKLRAGASDERWRIREAIAMALQTIGQSNMNRLIEITSDWSEGNLFEQRAAVAGICEPALLRNGKHAIPVFDLLNKSTRSIGESERADTPGYRVLKKGLGYTWSVAVAAYPDPGREEFQHWIGTTDRDINWIIRENLKKKRLRRLDPEWVQIITAKIGRPR